MRAFTITWGDRTWTDEQVVAAHVISVADILGDAGFEVSPWDGVKQLAAWIAVLLAGDRVVSLPVVDEASVARLTAECIAEVYGASPSVLLDALSPRLLSVPPQGDAVDVAA